MAEIVKKAMATVTQNHLLGPQTLMIERGLGCGYRAIVSLHKDYTDYKKFLEWLRHFPFLGKYSIEGFLINLDAEVRLKPLRFRRWRLISCR